MLHAYGCTSSHSLSSDARLAHARADIQGQLLLSALSITTHLLREGGTFVAKIFRGRGTPLLYAQLKTFFPDVYIAKPKSSRTSSVEAFVVCRNFTIPAGFVRGRLRDVTTSEYDNDACDIDLGASDVEALLVPFVACGDLSGYDADANYDLPEVSESGGEHEQLEPIRKPTTLPA